MCFWGSGYFRALVTVLILDVVPALPRHCLCLCCPCDVVDAGEEAAAEAGLDVSCLAWKDHK